MEEQGKESFAAGLRKLGEPGVRGNLFALFLLFGVIKEQECNEDERNTREKVRH